jgi:hypothetical protein
MELTINGCPQILRSNELLIEVINRGDVKIPQVCHHPQDVVQGVAVAVSEAIGCHEKQIVEPPGLFSLLSRFRRKESRRSIALLSKFLQTLGDQIKLRRSSD